MNDTNPTNERAVDITRILSERTEIHEAIREAGQRAIREHQLAGQPLVVWRDGGIVWLDPYTLEAVSAPT